MKSGLSGLFTVGFLGIGVPGHGQPAGMALRLDNAQLVGRSDVVVHGRVSAVNRIGTASEATIDVGCSLKGAPGKHVRVTFSPGQAESPLFAPDEVVLLFLSEVGAGRYQTTGGEQGKFAFGKAAPRAHPPPGPASDRRGPAAPREPGKRSRAALAALE